MIQAREIQAYIGGVCVRGPHRIMARAMSLPRNTFWRWIIADMQPGDTIHLNEYHLNRFIGARV
jgi:hypothetical protein